MLVPVFNRLAARMAPRLHRAFRNGALAPKEAGFDAWRLHRPREPDVVVDHRARPNRNPSGCRLVEIVEDDLVTRHFAEKVREHVDRHLLAWAASIAEAERREAGVVANRIRLPVGHREHGAKAAIGDAGLAAVAHGERRDVERAARQTDLLAFRLVDIGARWHAEKAFRLESLGF